MFHVGNGHSNYYFISLYLNISRLLCNYYLNVLSFREIQFSLSLSLSCVCVYVCARAHVCVRGRLWVCICIKAEIPRTNIPVSDVGSYVHIHTLIEFKTTMHTPNNRLDHQSPIPIFWGFQYFEASDLCLTRGLELTKLKRSAKDGSQQFDQIYDFLEETEIIIRHLKPII